MEALGRSVNRAARNDLACGLHNIYNNNFDLYKPLYGLIQRWIGDTFS